MKNKIGIAGGGIAGLTLATALKKLNYEIEIYEQSEVLKEVGAAISVWPNAMNVMKYLEVDDKLLNLGGIIENIYIKKSDGKILSETLPDYSAPPICIHRADLHNTLLNACNNKPLLNHKVASYKEHKNGVTVQFTNGQSREVNLLVGADGINSNIRKQLINDGDPIFRGYNIWRGVCKTNFDIGYASETLGKGKRVGIVPIKQGYYGWWATANEPFSKSDEPLGTREKLLKLFGDWHDPIPELIQNSKDILKNSLYDREFKRGWYSNNVVLIGDAAHPTTPNLGQGGCMAIEGAFILANCIENYGLEKRAYAKYEQLHWKRAKQVVDNSRKIGQMGQIENPMLIGLRNSLFSLMPSKLNMKIIDKYFGHDVTTLQY